MLTRPIATPLTRALTGPAAGAVPPAEPITWNPADANEAYSLSAGDLTVTKTGTSWVSLRSLLGVQTGIVQVEFGSAYVSTPNCIVGIGTASAALSSFVGSDAHAYGFYLNNGGVYHNGSGTPTGAPASIGQVIDAIIVLEAGLFVVRADGSPIGSFDFSALSGDLYAMMAIYDSGGVMAGDFGQNGFTNPDPGAIAWARQ